LPLSRSWRLALFAALVTRLNAAASSLPIQLAGLPSRVAAHLFFAPQTGLRHYWKAMQNTDQTFKGLYHWNYFDAAVLLPYFAVMIVLALYGVHRYTMCYLARITGPMRLGALRNCRW
jgi:hypothetical protein